MNNIRLKLLIFRNLTIQRKISTLKPLVEDAADMTMNSILDSKSNNLTKITFPSLLARELESACGNDSNSDLRCKNSQRPRSVRKLELDLEPTSFYRRELPAHLISFTSTEGRQLFKEALDAGQVENYFSLVGNFTTQSDVAFCGLGSLAMVLNALEVDPGKNWKGVWRWYSDEMLECCSPLEAMRERGITFDQFIDLSRCHGLGCTAKRFDQTTYEDFLADLSRTSTVHGLHMVISFARPSMGQTGIGHFSPVGAYHAGRRLALVLDVARFKYPSYWAPVDMLWRAMQPIDEDTGRSRGYTMLSLANPRITGCP